MHEKGINGDQRGPSIQEDGFSIRPQAFQHQEIEDLICAISLIDADDGVRSRGGVYAVRNLLHLSPSINELAHSSRLLEIVAEYLGKAAFPVRGILFDKTSAANWLVPWHQDLTICVASRVDVPGYGPWTVKAGLSHVQPPISILEKMLSVRIHLDDCDADNGALRVLPGTHRLGRLTGQEISEQQRFVTPMFCAAREGDIVLMRPLLLHASSAASKAAHRRVIHIDYASSQLDGGLRWLAETPKGEATELRKEAKRSVDATRVTNQKIGRNQPCPCGSGKKFKKCCGT